VDRPNIELSAGGLRNLAFVEGEASMNRDEITQRILSAKRKEGLTFAAIAEAVGRSPAWVTAALFGQATMSAEEALKATTILGLGPEEALALQEIPSRGAGAHVVPTDPTLYRFHEMLEIYGTTLKALIHEEFGDGIMSAVNFEVDVKRLKDPDGDRVVITLNGKFLEFRKW
jgi:cyanate lyase